MLPFWFFWLPIMAYWTDASKSLACLQFLDAGGNVSGTGTTAHGSWFQDRARRDVPSAES